LHNHQLPSVAADAAKYAPLFAPDKPNLHFIDVHDADAIQDAFGTVSKKIAALQQKLTVRTTTTTTTTTSVVRAPAVRRPATKQSSAQSSQSRIQIIQR
jgi:hypothetical protein